MPVGLWNDADGSRYEAALLQPVPARLGPWRLRRTPGDRRLCRSRPLRCYAQSRRRPHRHAEIYRQVETIAEVIEAVAVGEEWQGDQRTALCVRLLPGVELTEDLQRTIRSRIRSGTTPRHVPARILAVTEIPRTRSGKISEIAVRDTTTAERSATTRRWPTRSALWRTATCPPSPKSGRPGQCRRTTARTSLPSRNSSKPALMSSSAIERERSRSTGSCPRWNMRM